MGSLLHLTAWTADEAAPAPSSPRVFAEFDRLEQLLSVWREGSDVLRLNAAAGQAPVTVHEDTRRVLDAARQVSDWTDGAFDITFGALADIWKFDHDQDDRVPTPEEVAARQPLVDYRYVHVDPGPGTAVIERAGMKVHLGGIGKGYAVDRAVAVLREAGLRDFMVQAGGDLYVAGVNGDVPWRLGIQDPRGPADATFATLDVSRTPPSALGRLRAVLRPRRRPLPPHLSTRRTGQPARGIAQCDHRHRQATAADGLSTGVFVLGPERRDGAGRTSARGGGRDCDGRQPGLVSSGLRGRLHIGRRRLLA